MRRLLLLTLTLAIAVPAASGCRGNKSKEPPVHPNRNMDFQDYYRAQEGNDWFTDGRAMRPPVAGTVARGHLKDNDHLYRGRGDDGRLVDELPEGMALDEALLARGEARYIIFCAPCHEPSGYGDGIVVQRGFKVPPPSFHEPRLQAMPLGYFFDVISQGKGVMQSYAAQIPAPDRWAIAAWVRVLQVSQRATKDDIPVAELKKIEGDSQ